MQLYWVAGPFGSMNGQAIGRRIVPEIIHRLMTPIHH
jgi:hypothetical protein